MCDLQWLCVFPGGTGLDHQHQKLQSHDTRNWKYNWTFKMTRVTLNYAAAGGPFQISDFWVVSLLSPANVGVPLNFSAEACTKVCCHLPGATRPWAVLNEIFWSF